MATVKDAVDLTTRTIDRRAFHFRNLVVLLVLIVLICGIWAGLKGSWIPLLGWLLLVPLCGWFLVLDSFLVDRWHEGMLGMWALEELDLNIFAKSITGIRLLPSGTLGAMLAILPTIEIAPGAGKLSPAMKKAIALTLKTLQRCKRNQMVFAALAYTLALAFLAWAAILWDWLPLLGCLVWFPVRWIGHVAGSWRWRRLIRPWLQGQAQDLDMATLVSLIKQQERQMQETLLETLSPKLSH